jgi:hypothetical protein
MEMIGTQFAKGGGKGNRYIQGMMEHRISDCLTAEPDRRQTKQEKNR